MNSRLNLSPKWSPMDNSRKDSETQSIGLYLNNSPKNGITLYNSAKHSFCKSAKHLEKKSKNYYKTLSPLKPKSKSPINLTILMSLLTTLQTHFMNSLKLLKGVKNALKMRCMYLGEVK
jgi:hypothetical protein